MFIPRKILPLATDQEGIRSNDLMGCRKPIIKPVGILAV